MVLLHRDFNTCNIMVAEETSVLTGVIDWAEAEIGPFGLNLYSLFFLTGKVHLSKGCIPFEDYNSLNDTFWTVLLEELGGLSEQTLASIKNARMLGLLLSHGFTSRLANKDPHVPISEDNEIGQYQMRYLDGLLLNPATRLA
jgi:hypothetical protein